MTFDEILKLLGNETIHDFYQVSLGIHLTNEQAKAIAAKIRAAEELATEVRRLADYWGKTSGAMLALDKYEKTGGEG